MVKCLQHSPEVETLANGRLAHVKGIFSSGAYASDLCQELEKVEGSSKKRGAH